MIIVQREQWGARPPKNTPQRISLPSPGLWLHHFATDAWHGPAGMRACQKFHQDSRGWADIGYSFTVDLDTTVYEARGAGVAGAHTSGHNTTSHAISVMGNFDVSRPSEQVIQTIADLVRFGHREGWWPSQLTGGHRDVGQSACPGRYLYPLIGEINRRARASTPEPVIEPEEDDVMFVTTAATSTVWFVTGGVRIRLTAAKQADELDPKWRSKLKVLSSGHPVFKLQEIRP